MCGCIREKECVHVCEREMEKIESEGGRATFVSLSAWVTGVLIVQFEEMSIFAFRLTFVFCQIYQHLFPLNIPSIHLLGLCFSPSVSD